MICVNRTHLPRADVEETAIAEPAVAVEKDAVRVFHNYQLAHVPERRVPDFADIVDFKCDAAWVRVWRRWIERRTIVAAIEHLIVNRAIGPTIVGIWDATNADVELSSHVLAFRIIIGKRCGVVI